MGVVSVEAANAKQCCRVQDILLAEIIDGINPQRLRTSTWGVTEMLKAAEATPGMSTINVMNDKSKPASDSFNIWEIRYKSKRCPTPAADENCTDPCEDISSDPIEWKYAQPTMTTGLHHEFAINFADWRAICESPTSDLNQYLFEAYEDLKGKANQRYIDQIVAVLSNYFSPSGDCDDAVSSASDPMTLFLNDAQGHPQPRGFFPLINQYRRMGIRNLQPLFAGGTGLDLMEWQNDLYINATDELTDRNISRFNNRGMPRVFVDYDIDSTYGDGTANGISILPGSVHRLFWNYFEGVNAYKSDTLVKQKFDLGALFGDPGFIVDQSVYVKECGACDIKIVYKFWLYTDLFWLPSDLFNEDCGQCSNYLLRWLIDCGALDCATLTQGSEVIVP